MKEVYRSPPFDLEGYIAYTVKYSDGSRGTILEHREVMERVLGRKLKSFELIHHENENKRDNDPSNLKLTNRARHTKHHQQHREIEWIDLVYLNCDKLFKRMTKDERHNRKQGKRGPYCGRSCARQAQTKEYK